MTWYGTDFVRRLYCEWQEGYMAKKQATKAAKAAKAKAPKTPKKKGSLARGLDLVKRVLTKGEQVLDAVSRHAPEPGTQPTPRPDGDATADPGSALVVPQRVKHGETSDLALGSGQPVTPSQMDQMTAALVAAAPEQFAILPAAEYETDPALPGSRPQPGFVSLPSPLFDDMDDGSRYVWKHAAVIDGRVVLQGQLQKEAPKGRVLRGAGRNLTAELQQHQQEIADAAKAAGQADVPEPTAKPAEDHPANARLPAVLHTPGTPAEGRHFRALCAGDLPAERLRGLAEYLVAASLGVHTSNLMGNQLQQSTLDARAGGRKRADPPIEPLYPGGSGGGGLY